MARSKPKPATRSHTRTKNTNELIQNLSQRVADTLGRPESRKRIAVLLRRMLGSSQKK